MHPVDVAACLLVFQIFLNSIFGAGTELRFHLVQGRSSGHGGVFNALQWLQIVVLVQVSSYVTDGSRKLLPTMPETTAEFKFE